MIFGWYLELPIARLTPPTREQLCLACWPLFHSAATNIKEQGSGSTEPETEKLPVVVYGKTWMLHTPVTRTFFSDPNAPDFESSIVAGDDSTSPVPQSAPPKDKKSKSSSSKSSSKKVKVDDT